MSRDAIPVRTPAPFWPEAVLDVTTLSESGASISLKADADRLRRIAARLGLQDATAFQAHYDIRVMMGGGLLARGAIQATLMRECVVTGRPIEEKVEETFRLRLLTEQEDPVAESDPDDPDVEIAAGNRIDLGEIAVQQLAVAMAPYPRGPDADAALARFAAGGGDAGPPDDRPETPLSALAAKWRKAGGGESAK